MGDTLPFLISLKRFLICIYIQHKNIVQFWDSLSVGRFYPTAHKVGDSRKPPGCSGSLQDPRHRAVAGSMSYSFAIASTLHREYRSKCYVYSYIFSHEWI